MTVIPLWLCGTVLYISRCKEICPIWAQKQPVESSDVVDNETAVGDDDTDEWPIISVRNENNCIDLGIYFHDQNALMFKAFAKHWHCVDSWMHVPQPKIYDWKII